MTSQEVIEDALSERIRFAHLSNAYPSPAVSAQIVLDQLRAGALVIAATRPAETKRAIVDRIMLALRSQDPTRGLTYAECVLRILRLAVQLAKEADLPDYANFEDL